MKTRIAIIGAGLSGLTAGYLLLKKNSSYPDHTQVEFTIFEATNRVGGRVFTLREFEDDLFAELGAMSICSNEENLLSLINELGLKLIKRSDRRPRFYKDGKWLDQVNNDIKKIIQFLMGEAKRLRDEKIIIEDKDWLAEDEAHQQLNYLDSISIIEFLKQSISSKKLTLDNEKELLANTSSSLLGLYSDDVEKLSAWDALRYLSQYLTSQGCYSIENGNDQLPATLGKLLHKHIMLNMPVSQITLDSNDHLLVTFNSGTIQKFNYIIIAAPLTSLKKDNIDHIKFEPPLPKEKEKAINKIAYTQNIGRTYFLSKTRFWNNENPQTGMVITDNLWIEDHTAHVVKDKGIIEAHSRGKLASFIINADDPKEKSAEAIKTVYGKCFEENCTPANAVNYFWKNEPYQRGVYPFFQPKQKKYLARWRENVGRIFFISDNSIDCPASINGAVKSAYETIQKIRDKIAEEMSYTENYLNKKMSCY